MAKLKKRDINKALKELTFEAAPLSTNKGRYIRGGHNKRTPKAKRHSGWVTARWAEKGDYQEEMAEGNDPIYFYDAWQDIHDGLPNYHNYKDFTHFHPGCLGDDEVYLEIKELNKKLKRMAKIRKAKLAKKKLLST